MRTRQRPPVLINRGHLLTRFRDRHIRLRRTGNALDIAHGSATATWRHVAQTLDAQHDAVGVSHFHGGRRRRRVLLGRAGAVHAGDARERGLLHSLTPLHARCRPRCVLERAERRRAQLIPRLRKVLRQRVNYARRSADGRRADGGHFAAAAAATCWCHVVARGRLCRVPTLRFQCRFVRRRFRCLVVPVHPVRVVETDWRFEAGFLVGGGGGGATGTVLNQVVDRCRHWATGVVALVFVDEPNVERAAQDAQKEGSACLRARYVMRCNRNFKKSLFFFLNIMFQSSSSKFQRCHRHLAAVLIISID